jgi:hypothetical protein
VRRDGGNFHGARFLRHEFGRFLCGVPAGNHSASERAGAEQARHALEQRWKSHLKRELKQHEPFLEAARRISIQAPRLEFKLQLVRPDSLKAEFQPEVARPAATARTQFNGIPRRM